jgi:hypothetical protein
MHYDPTRTALYYPERQPPLAIDTARWPRDAICAELCRRVYSRFEEDGEEAIRATLSASGFRDIALFDAPSTDTQALAALSAEGHAFIAFRGTQKDRRKDVLIDLWALPARWDRPGWVHRGFRNALNSVKAPMLAWIEGHKGAPLLITGHSLGGALATLLAALRPEAELVTFGSPRVGFSRFAKGFQGRAVRRYVDCCDAVSRIPPGWLGFAHVAPLTYIDRSGQVITPLPDTATIRADQVEGRAIYQARYWSGEGHVTTRRLADHAPVNYVSALLGIRDQAD